MKEKDLILNYYFLSGLLLLILNDAFLKWHFSNTLTGKLSDFAGLFIFALFVAYIFPKFKKQVSLLIGIAFIFWKSPLSTPLIELFNTVCFFKINRVIDTTDLVALCILPFSHYLINHSNLKPKSYKGLKGFLKVCTLLIAMISFTATSMIRYEMPKGTIYLGKSHKVKLSKEAILNKLDQLGYQWEYKSDTISNGEYYHHNGYYQINEVIIEKDGIALDTLENIKFQLRHLKKDKTKIELINVKLKGEGNIQDWKYLKHLNTYYKGQLKKHFINDIKESKSSEIIN